MSKTNKMNKIYKFLFAIFVLCTIHNIFCYAVQPKTPQIIKPPFITPTDRSSLYQYKNTKKNFAHSDVQFAYFIQELTNFRNADPSNYFHGYIDPNIPEQVSLFNSFNIYKKILLLKNIEKSPKERASAQNIARFLGINYKTQTIPAYAYVNNLQLHEPFISFSNWKLLHLNQSKSEE